MLGNRCTRRLCTSYVSSYDHLAVDIIQHYAVDVYEAACPVISQVRQRSAGGFSQLSHRR